MNFLKEHFDRADYLEKVKKRVKLKKDLTMWIKMLGCNHTTIMHRAHDGFDRFQCTKCNNTEVKQS